MRIKICGITRAEDALLAAELGVDALGFVFWPSSPRFIDPYRARDIVAALPSFVTPVGVFVDQPVEYVNGVASLVRLGAVQLHGHEDASYWPRVKHRIIKSVPIAASPECDHSAQGSDDGPRGVDLAIDRLPPSILPLLDVHDPVKRGGTGRTIDWAVGGEVARRRRIILSGGLRPENVNAAIAAVRPYAIDVSSGVEEMPGVKDHDRLRALFDSARGSVVAP